MSVLLAMVHGYACITHGGNQVVSGLALNILASGLTAVLGVAWFAQGGRTPQLPGEARFLPLEWPGAAALRDVPGLGAVYGELLSGHNLIVYLAFLAVPAVGWMLYRTRFGLRLRAAGEESALRGRGGGPGPGAALPGARMHRCPLRGGRDLPVARPERRVHQRHDRGQGLHCARGADLRQVAPGAGDARLPALRPAGRGGHRLQGTDIPGVGEVPVQLVQALPYVLTVVLLAGFIGRAVPPRALGVPYVKER